MEEYKELNLKSSDYYKHIKNVVFTPIKEIKTQKVFKKGDEKIWKLLGIIPLFHTKYDEDYYTTEYSDGELRRHSAILGISNSFFKDGKFYHKAVVKIHIDNGFNEYYYFEDNKSAMNFLNSIKENCEKCQNKLF